MRLILAFLLGMTLAWAFAHSAYSRDSGQWEESDPTTRLWFQQLKQPDNGYSCCGESDGYYADEYHMEGDKLVAVITDDRDDTKLQRPHVNVGTKYVVPPNKLVDATKQHGNPTGHSIIFLGTINWFGSSENTAIENSSVLCFVLGSGS